MLLQPGKIVQNRYRIAKLLGQGGFGAVYRAWDISLDRAVALKENTEATPDAQRQFEREAKILSHLRHPNLPQVTDYFIVPGEGQYLVMDLVEGEDLQEMLDRLGRPLPEADAVRWIVQVCGALEYLHLQTPPVIHRDIKPANIKITPGTAPGSAGKAILVDFGIAKVYQANLDTTIGARAVTPGYSPQEQYGKGVTDARSDIYSLGATLYAILTNSEPPESVQRTLGTALVAPRTLNPAISSRTELAILQAMQVAPANRFQTASEFRSALLAPSRPANLPTPVKQPAAPPQAIPGSAPPPPLAPQPAPQPASPAPAAGKPRWSLMNVALIAGALLLILLFAWAASSADELIQKWVVEPRAIRAALETLAAPTLTPKPTRTPPPMATHWRPSKTPVTPLPSPTRSRTPTRTPEVATATQASATPTPLFSPSPTPSVAVVDSRVSARDGMLLVYVPAGEFVMGASDSMVGVHVNELPLHTVNLDAFWIDQAEVTNAMYALCVRDKSCPIPSGNMDFNDPNLSNHPVVRVSWANAKSYCAWAGRRLPSEAEWEKAARGDDGRIYPWGNTLPAGARLNYCDRNCPDPLKDARGDDGYAGTSAVGVYPAGVSPFGVLDMAGNVWEWVADWYSENYYALSPSNNPPGPPGGSEKVLRGSNWYTLINDLRITVRSHFKVNTYLDRLGFRCAQ